MKPSTRFPRKVIQGAVVNAIAHRDYTSAASVQVSVFPDRIEVRNPGSLPTDLTFEDLKIEHNSRPRNHRIASLLYVAHYIEKIGYGTIQMMTGCKGAGLPEPESAQSGGEFVVTLRIDRLTADRATPIVFAGSMGVLGRRRPLSTSLLTLPRETNLRDYTLRNQGKIHV